MIWTKSNIDNMIKWLGVMCAFFITSIVSAQSPYESLYSEYKNKIIELKNTNYKIVRIVKQYEVIELLPDTVKVSTELTLQDYIADSIKLLYSINNEEKVILFTDYKVVGNKLVEIEKGE